MCDGKITNVTCVILLSTCTPEEEKKEGEEEAPKAEEAAEGEAKPEGEAEPKAEGAAAGGEVTVEVEVEQGADKGQRGYVHVHIMW